MKLKVGFKKYLIVLLVFSFCDFMRRLSEQLKDEIIIIDYSCSLQIEDNPQVIKLYFFNRNNFDINLFFRYNSGGKKFTKIHTKSLTVTIDGFTIHNALWLGKKANLPSKRDMALVV